MEHNNRFRWRRLPLLILGFLALAVFLGKGAFDFYWYYQVKWQTLALVVETEEGKTVDVFITPQRTLDGRLVLPVRQIKGDAAKIGLAKGDIIFEVDGKSVTRWDDTLTRRTPDGVTFTVMRQITPSQVHLQLLGARGAPEFLASFTIPPHTFYLWIAFGILGLSMLVVGILVYLKSATQPATLLLLMGIVLTLPMEIVIPNLPHFKEDIAVYLIGFVIGTTVTLFVSFSFHFLLIFPQKKRIMEKLGKAVYLIIYLPSIAYFLTILVTYATVGMGGLEGKAGAIIEGKTGAIIGGIITSSMGLYGIFGFIALRHSYKTATSPIVKGQTRTLLFGFRIGLFVPAIIILCVTILLILKISPPRIILLGIFLTPALLLALPTSFGYAILKQGMLDVGFVLARSMSYLAITAIAIGIYLGLVIGVGKGLLALTDASSQTFTIGATLLVAVLFAPLQGWTRRAIDRRFHRERYDAQELLAQFSRDLPSMMELSDILSALTERLTSALYPRSLSILLPSASGKEFIVAETTGDAPKANPLRIDDSGLIKQLQETRRPFICYQLDSVSESLTENDIALLQSQETVLCVPMLVQDRLVGVLNLGFKLTDSPYNREDLRLLTTVAGNAAIAVENARLSNQKVEQERMQEELNRARQIQLAILPRTPSIESIEIASFCEPATEVGGDYYDFVNPPSVREEKVENDGGLGFAIGDVTGHGMAAALLVSMAHSCLHATTRKSASVEEVMSAMNAMVFSVGERERLMQMTFSYSIINPHKQHLQFASAGHLPPYHYISTTDTLKAIEHGAFPLGVLQKIDYPSQIVPITPGDRLIYYSDGLIEALNETEEFYGFERFEASIRQNIQEPVEAMLKLILKDVRNYCGDVPQEDDMTLVIIAL